MTSHIQSDTQMNTQTDTRCIKIDLKHPVHISGALTSKLAIRRPKVKDMINVDQSKQSDAQKEVNLFANLCELTPENIMDLDMADYAQLQRAYQDFLS